MTLHVRNVGDHRGAFIAEREPALVAQEQLAADALFEPVDPAHQGRGGEPELLGGNRVYYLAVPPAAFPTIVEALGKRKDERGWNPISRSSSSRRPIRI